MGYKWVIFYQLSGLSQLIYKWDNNEIIRKQWNRSITNNSGDAKLELEFQARGLPIRLLEADTTW